jgi:hypothetical protein
MGLAACSTVNDKALRLLSSKVSVFAIVNGELLTGDLNLTPDRSGKMTLIGQSGVANATIHSCVGQSRYEASNSGVIDLRCDDGTNTSMRFSLISETRGYAYGATGQGRSSLAFGLPASEARAYLQVPANQKLTLVSDDKLALQ